MIRRDVPQKSLAGPAGAATVSGMPRVTLFLLFCIASVLLRAEPEFPKMGPDIYDTKAVGSKLVDEAIREAKASGKHVLLDFGANWCIWCRRLHHTFTTNAEIQAALQKDYVLVMIDLNSKQGKMRNADLNTRYGNVLQHGIPVLVVLDSDGKQLTTQETGALEDGKDAHDPAKILAFLAQWTLKR